MPLNFGEAYKIVCPNGGAVAPNSKEYKDIMELMRQSGHTTFRDTVVEDTTPRIPRSVEEAKPYMETPQLLEKPLLISRHEWMSVDANRQCFLNALNKNKTKS